MSEIWHNQKGAMLPFSYLKEHVDYLFEKQRQMGF